MRAESNRSTATMPTRGARRNACATLALRDSRVAHFPRQHPDSPHYGRSLAPFLTQIALSSQLA